MNKGQEFEEKFVKKVADIIRNSSMTAKSFASLAFPDQAKPDNKWQRIYANMKKGKRQNVTLEDAYTMAKTIGQDLSSIVWAIEKELKEVSVHNASTVRNVSTVKKKVTQLTVNGSK